MYTGRRICHYSCTCFVKNYKLLSNDVNNLKYIVNKIHPTSVARKHESAVKKLVMSDQSEAKVLPVNKFTSRTHTCGELTKENIGDVVKLNGWLEFQRMGKFITLRDAYGTMQLIVPDDRKDLMDVVKNLAFESVLSVTGEVVARPEGQENPKMETGYIEMKIQSITVLNNTSRNLPFQIREFKKAGMQAQMKYRYLALRFSDMQRNLRLRSSVIMKMREYLMDCGFVEIETPTLFRSTPGGAQEFLVPTRQNGHFYSLVQSPQQFKQLLMVGGIDRYFQVARCYRDERVRHDRQPEFTQLDIELSFTDSESVMELVENILMHSWPQGLNCPTAPFKRMKYEDAMELYGSDQPDLRIPQKIINLADIIDASIIQQNISTTWDTDFGVYAIVFPSLEKNLTNSVKEQFLTFKKENFNSTKLLQLKIGGDNWRSSLDKIFSPEITDRIIQHLNIDHGEAVFITFGDPDDARKLLGKIRTEFVNIAESKGQNLRTSENELVWITDFPLFSIDKETGALKSNHHPFTQPHPEDIDFLTTNPLKVRSLHYDLVMNGSEIGGGSIRIHDANLQRQILKILNINESHLEHLLNALDHGAPPHGGIALGLDRLICLLCNAESIRSVIAFPKTMEGRDLMSNAPAPISTEEAELYHIKIVDK